MYTIVKMNKTLTDIEYFYVIESEYCLELYCCQNTDEMVDFLGKHNEYIPVTPNYLQIP